MYDFKSEYVRNNGGSTMTRVFLMFFICSGSLFLNSSCSDEEPTPNNSAPISNGETKVYYPGDYGSIELDPCSYNNANDFCNSKGYTKAEDYSCRSVSRLIDPANPSRGYYTLTLFDTVVCWRGN